MGAVTITLLPGDYELWEINDGVCRSFLVVGKERALLWDTGIGACNLKKEIAAITEKPYDVVLSHGHWDHIGGIEQFDEVWLHPDDQQLLQETYCSRYNNNYTGRVRICPLQEKQRFLLGGTTLEVLFLPGHSDGCAALLSREHHYALTGDMFLNDAILLFSDSSDFEKYRASLNYFMDFRDDIQIIYPSHCQAIDFEDVDRIRKTVEDYMTGGKSADRFYLKIVGKEKWVKKFNSNGIDLLLRDDAQE